MPQITTSGIVSGIDVNSIVEQLVAAERQPMDLRYERQEISIQTELSAYGSLKSAIDSFSSKMTDLQLSSTYQQRTVNVFQDTQASVDADTSAAPGSYSVTVNELATHHKLSSKTYTDTDAIVGTGTISITSGDDSFDVEIDVSNDQLSQVRDAINNAEDNDAVFASIVTDENGSHLIFTAKNSGLDNEISITTTPSPSDTGDLSELNYADTGGPYSVSEKVAALDAEIDVDGFILKSSSNEFNESIDGVTIDISGTTKTETFGFEVAQDKGSVKATINEFVAAYNELMKGLNALTSYDAETTIAGPLQGDILVNQLSNALRSSLSTNIEKAPDGVDSLASVGITTNYEDGTLSLDLSQLDDVMDSDFSSIAKLMSGEGGIADAFKNAMEPYVKFDGMIDTRLGGLETSLDRLNDQRITLNQRMEQMQARYQAQFFAMDRIVSELTNTGNFLAQQLDNLPGFTRDKS